MDGVLTLTANDAVRVTPNLGFARDPLDGAAGHAKLLCGRAGCYPRLQQLLNSMAIEHPEHPPRASGDRDSHPTVNGPTKQGGSQLRQNLEKKCDIFWRTHTKSSNSHLIEADL